MRRTFLTSAAASLLATSALGAPHFSLSGGTVDSGSPVPFVIHRTSRDKSAAVVTFQTADGTATAGTDYAGTSSIISFPAGLSSLAVPVASYTNLVRLGQTLQFQGQLRVSGRTVSTAGGSIIEPAATPTPTPTPVPLPPPPVISAATYDAAVGLSVDANGFADLSLRGGAKQFFVNSSTGADANGCTGAQSAATPLKTYAAARACVTNTEGDHILLAQDTSYPEELNNLQAQMGFSAQYPTVIESYDPADPNNTALYGRAANGHRPVLTGLMPDPITCCGNGTNSYLAIVGLDFNPGNAPKQCIVFQASSAYILIENNILRAVCLSFDIGSTPRDDHHIVRGNSLYGEWTGDGSHIGGIYDAGTNNITLEDNVFWHNGWKVGISRDTDQSLGGPTVFNHPVYMQTNTGTTVMRRNVIADGAADGSSLRGAAMAFTENLSINNPIQLGMGGGVNYYIDNPNGDDLQASYNAFIGSANLNSTNPRNIGATSYNGKIGSTFSHNLIARSQVDGGGTAIGVQAFATAAAFNQPSYLLWDHNVVYLWSTPGNELYGGSLDAFPAQALPTYTNNVWDEPASGTNVNVAAYSPPNPYTIPQLMTAIGYASYDAWIAWAIEHPEQHPARAPRALLFTGYGVP